MLKGLQAWDFLEFLGPNRNLIRVYAPEGKIRKNGQIVFVLAQHMWKQFLMKAIVVHFIPIILVPNWIFKLVINISHACVSLMKENGGVGWNR